MLARVSTTATTPTKSKTDLFNSVDKFTVSLETQEVLVTSSSLSLEDVQAKIAKTGKQVCSEIISRETFSHVLCLGYLCTGCLIDKGGFRSWKLIMYRLI